MSCIRSCCDSKDCITEAKRRSWRYEGAKDDLSIEDLFELAEEELVVSAEVDDILGTAVALDFFPILTNDT